MHLSNPLNRQSTLEGHISLVWTPFWCVQLLMEISMSILSYATDFSSIEFVVCEIHRKYWRWVWTVTLILVETCKNFSLIWTPLGLNYISKWRIGSLFSYATSFTSIRFLVCEISLKYQRSPAETRNRVEQRCWKSLLTRVTPVWKRFVTRVIIHNSSWVSPKTQKHCSEAL